jgi:twitching motility protein PilT
VYPRGVSTTPYASEAFLHQLLGKALAAQACDVHLKVGQPPGARVRGDMVYFRVEKIRPEDTEAAVRLIIGGISTGNAGAEPRRGGRIEGSGERVLAYEAGSVGRFRVTIYRQRGSLALVLRSVPRKVPSLDELGLPPAVTALLEQGRGIVVVAGGIGQGRTTTLAAMVGHVNGAAARHLITVEDPIEFLHEDGRASVSQREVGADVASLAVGLRAGLRQDPDLVAVSSIDAEETLAAALDVAEAGRLVLGGLTAIDARRAVSRLLGRAAPGDRERVAEALQGVVAQRLVPKRDGSSLVLAVELLVVTPPVREALRRAAASGGPIEPAVEQLLEKGAAHGMQTFDAHLGRLATQGLIARSPS